MARVIWSDQALQDIDNIAEYIALDSPKYAKLQVLNFFKSAEALEGLPTIGRIVPEIENPSIRERIVGSAYRIIYKVNNPDLVTIITIHHSSRLLRARIILRDVE